jgi:hypothetical protein
MGDAERVFTGRAEGMKAQPVGVLELEASMTPGHCLCGAVRFEVLRFAGPFELCHCTRCRRVSGSAFLAAVGVRREDFRWLHGRENVRTFDAPILHGPPAYRSCFCERCGSPVPDPTDDSAWFELPAGLLEGDPGLRPDKHIMIQHQAVWYEIHD